MVEIRVPAVALAAGIADLVVTGLIVAFLATSFDAFWALDLIDLAAGGLLLATTIMIRVRPLAVRLIGIVGAAGLLVLALDLPFVLPVASYAWSYRVGAILVAAWVVGVSLGEAARGWRFLGLLVGMALAVGQVASALLRDLPSYVFLAWAIPFGLWLVAIGLRGVMVRPAAEPMPA